MADVKGDNKNLFEAPKKRASFGTGPISNCQSTTTGRNDLEFGEESASVSKGVFCLTFNTRGMSPSERLREGLVRIGGERRESRGKKDLEKRGIRDKNSLFMYKDLGKPRGKAQIRP